MLVHYDLASPRCCVTKVIVNLQLNPCCVLQPYHTLFLPLARADLVGDMIAEAADMNADLTQQYRTLCGIKRKLLRLKADRNYSLEDVHHYQLMVDAVDSKRVNGIFGGDLQNVPAGQAQCSTILHQDYGEQLRLLIHEHMGTWKLHIPASDNPEKNRLVKLEHPIMRTDSTVCTLLPAQIGYVLW